jgi:hypothetical protein
MSKIKAAVLALMACLSLTGCQEKPATDQAAKIRPGAPPVVVSGTPAEQVQKTVLRYNQLLAQGYQSLNMTPLQEVASKDQAEKAYVHMAALGEGKVKMQSQLNKITFGKLDFPQPDKCRTTTDELWDFAYLDIQTGAKQDERKNFLYHVNYSLELQGGRWVVTDIVASFEEPAAQQPQPRSLHGDKPLPDGHGAAVDKSRK